MLDREFREEVVNDLLALLPVGRDQFSDGQQVLFDGQSTEDRGFLRQVANPEASASIHRQHGNVMAIQQDLAAVDRDQSRDHVEAGCLAGSIRAQKANGLATAHLE
jgi:hypothetical protein